MEYKIDPLSSSSPDMDAAEFAALKQSIADIGQLVSIVVAGGKIIDGRKRYQACRELGKEPSVIEIPAEADPVEHAWALNLFRTQYTASQRAMYVSAIATRKRGDNLRGLDGAIGRQGVGVGIRCVNLRTLPPSDQSVADMAGVSRSAVTWAKRVRQDGIPEVVAAVERGDLALHTAKQIISKPRHEQSAAIQAAKDAPRRRDGRRAAAPTLTMRVQKAKPSLTRLENVINSLRSAADTLATLNIEACRAAPAERRQQWLTEFNDALRIIHRFRRQLAGPAVA